MQRLSTYIAQAPKKRLPPAVAEKTKHHVLDTIAAMVSGSRLPPGKRAISFARTRGGTREVCIVGSNIITSAENADRIEEEKMGRRPDVPPKWEKTAPKEKK